MKSLSHHRFPLYFILLLTFCLRPCPIDGTTVENFLNWHKSLDVGGPVELVYRPQNNVTSSSILKYQNQDFRGGLQQLQIIVGQAYANGRRVRAYGSRWSMSNIAYSSEYMVETWGLTYCQIGLNNLTLVSPLYQPKHDRLVFVQTGIMIKHLGKALHEAGYSLTAMGGADGQRLGGAIATSTHGSAPRFGAMQDFVRGIHLVLSEDDHVFIQRETDPVVTAAFANDFLRGARLIQSNDMFEAAVVGLGSFGLVHAFVIEVEPLYTLRTQYKVLPFDSLKDALSSFDKMQKLDFGGVEDSLDLPFFLKISFNPYNLDRIFVAKYDKIMATTDSPLLVLSEEQATMEKQNFKDSVGDPFDIALQYFQDKKKRIRVLETVFVGVLRPLGNFIKRQMYAAMLEVGFLAYYNWHKLRNGMPIRYIFTTPGSGKEFQIIPIPTTEIEISVPMDRITEVVNIWLEIIDRRPILTPLAIRYVKGSNATAAFTRFDMSATLSLQAPWGRFVASDTEAIFEEIFEAMAATSIPYCWHWGKKQPKSSNWVVDSCLGIDAKNSWMRQREALIPDLDRRHMFANEQLEFLGLSS